MDEKEYSRTVSGLSEPSPAAPQTTGVQEKPAVKMSITNGSGTEDDGVSAQAKAREAALQEKARKTCQQMLDREQSMLLLFSRDQRLSYQADLNISQFSIQPDNQKVIVPASYFREQNFTETQMLFNLYALLALYPDWRRSPERYLERDRTWRLEARQITSFYQDLVDQAGLHDDPAWQAGDFYQTARLDLQEFYQGLDDWVSLLCVLERAPAYRNPELQHVLRDKLALQGYFGEEIHPLNLHRDLAPALLISELYGTNEIDAKEIRNMMEEPVFQMPRYRFLRQEMIRMINQDTIGIEKRDPFFEAFLTDCFMRLWRNDLRKIDMQPSRGQTQEQTSSSGKARKNRLAMKPEDRSRMLHQLQDKKKEHQKTLAGLEKQKPDLQRFGVGQDDEKLFHYYEALVRPERERMKLFWKKLIGNASKEVSVRIEDSLKGSLNVHSLINDWPDFVEAQEKQNYKDLAVFDAYELRRQTRILPEHLDISFVIDNSGSMRSNKIEAARQALTVILLSLNDFAEYLQDAGRNSHQKINLNTEVWLFGTSAKKVLGFEDRGLVRQARQILSIARLEGSGGSTNDGECLSLIEKSITPAMVREQQSGKRIRLIFEITDGASSFPGSTKKAIDKLKKKHCEIQAIEIGLKDDQEARRTFQFIFKDRGLFLGDRVGELPEELMKSVQKQVVSIFKKTAR